MPPPGLDRFGAQTAATVLLTGASGDVGSRLISLLEQQPVILRCFSRNPDKLRPLVNGST